MTLSTVRTLAGGVLTVLTALLLVAFLVQAVPAVVGADASYVVLSGSMEPTISPGDAVIVKSVDPAKIERGDVITYTRGDSSTPVTHRVVEVLDRETGLAFRTKGDANADPDAQPVPAENVTGKVWLVIPYIGHVVLFANTPTGIAVLVGLPLAALVLSELYSYARGGSTEGAAAGGDAEASDSASRTTKGDAAAAATTAASESTAEADEPATVALTPADLKISAVGFAALAVYSGYVAVQHLEAVHVSVFAAAALTLAFALTLLVFGDAEPTNSDRDGEGSGTPDVGEAAVPTRGPRFPFEEQTETIADGGTADSSPGGGDDES